MKSDILLSPWVRFNDVGGFVRRLASSDNPLVSVVYYEPVKWKLIWYPKSIAGNMHNVSENIWKHSNYNKKYFTAKKAMQVFDEMLLSFDFKLYNDEDKWAKIKLLL